MPTLKDKLFAHAHECLYAALGGSIGAATRVCVFAAVSNHILSTLLCNVFGTFLLAYVMQLENRISPRLRNSITAGFCGGLSIFASFSKDSVLAVKNKDFLLFFANFFANFSLCIIAVYAAFALVKYAGKVLIRRRAL